MLENLKQKFMKTLSVDNKPTLYLHGGSGKTGTKGIQRFLGENREKLREIGIDYPLIEGNPPVDKFPWPGNALRIGKSLNTGTITKSELNSIAKKIHSEIPPGITKVVLSDETFNATKPEDIKQFSAAFRKYFKIELIFFLRDPLLWSYSAWKQIVRSVRETRTFEQFLTETKIRQIKFAGFWFANVDNVHLISYDKHKKKIISTFFKHIGIDIDQYFSETNTVTANPSLNTSEVNCLRLFHSVPEFKDDLALCHKIANAFIDRVGRKTDAKPDPRLAALAIKNQEPMFKATDPYLDRSEIIRITGDNATPEGSKAFVGIDPDDVQTVLLVIAQHFFKDAPEETLTPPADK